MPLTTTDHDRGAAGLRYVYPVLSRRTGGVSVGVNLNPNRACNWRCLYCQVPGLVRGVAPEIDLDHLERELREFLTGILRGDWLERNAPPNLRRLTDVAFSGDGESTTAREFDRIVGRVVRVLYELRPRTAVRIVLITNGSQVERTDVLRGIARMGHANGEVWFKVDAGTAEGRRRINDARVSDERIIEGLVAASSVCRTRVQTMGLSLDGGGPDVAEQEALGSLLERARNAGAEVEDVMLYGLARPSCQPEAPRLAALSEGELEAYAGRLRQRGFAVRVHP